MALAVAAGGAQQSHAQLQRAIAEDAKINERAATSQRKIDGVHDETEALLGEYRTLSGRIDSLRVYNRELSGLVDSQGAEMDSLREQIENVTLVEREILPLMLRMLEALEQFVELDVPFLPEERGRRVAFLKDLLGRADVTVAEKYRRLLEAYQVENEYGRTIEAYEGELEIDGQSRTVDFLRIGRIGLLYQTLDRTRAGVWSQESREWADLDGAYRTSIDHGMRMARKQAAPDLLQLPVPAPTAASSSDRVESAR